MQFAYSRDLECDFSDRPSCARSVNSFGNEEIMRNGICEVCRTNKATQHIRFSMYGNVSRMLVGGKTFNRTTMTVSLCSDCVRKADQREKVRSTVSGFVFLFVGLIAAICTYFCNGSILAGAISGALFGCMAAGAISSAMADAHSKESICESVPRIKKLIDGGWHFGDKPGK